jgi:ABC-type molybdate transport system substrate-binding protein
MYAAAVSTTASNSQPALSLLILLASEETQAVLKGHGLAAP